MKIKMKTLIMTIFFLCAFSALGMTANAETDSTFEYYIENNKAVIFRVVSTENFSGVQSIPDTIGNYSVTRIENEAFRGCSYLTELNIPNSVTSIGGMAFAYCNNLEKITLPSNLKTIEYSLFENCSNLKEITIPNGVTIVDTGAFGGCASLSQIVIPDSVTSIEDGAFAGCMSLKKISIPETITEIDNSVFFNCRNLIEVSMSDSVTKIGNSAFTYCNSLNNIELSQNITSIGNRAFEGCSSLTNFTFPKNICEIGDEAFRACSNMVEIEIPSSILKMGNSVFCYCSNLKKISIPSYFNQSENLWKGDGVSAEISYYSIKYTITFEGDYMGTQCVEYPYNAVLPIAPNGYIYKFTIDGNEWTGEGVTSDITVNVELQLSHTITFNGDIEETQIVGHGENTKLPIAPSGYKYKFTVDGVEWDGKSVMSDITVNVEQILIHTVTFTGDIETFQIVEHGAAATLLTPPFGYEYIYTTMSGKEDVIDWDWGSITSDMTVSVQQIPLRYQYAVSNGEVTITDCDETINGRLILPDTIEGCVVTSIGKSAFYNCMGLSGVIIPNTVTSIGASAFYNCSSLKSIVIPDKVTSIGASAFKNCSRLTSITIPDSVSNIGYGILNGCTILNNITLPMATFGAEHKSRFGYIFGYDYEDYEAEIPTNATYQGYREKSSYSKSGYRYYYYYIPKSLKTVKITNSIEENAFYNCSNFTNVIIGENVNSVGSYAFYGCSGLNKVTINNIEKWCNIDFGNRTSNPLYYAKKLYLNYNEIIDLTIPDSVLSISDYAFADCSRLTSVTIADSVINIGANAFSNCIGLESITIPKSVTSIGEGAFSSCENLVSAIIPEGITAIEKNTFNNCSSLKNVTIADSVINIGANAFSNCIGLESITIPKSVISIGVNAFYKCVGLESITIPGSVTNIGTNAFSDCVGLKNVFIENGLKSIGDRAFYSCNSLESITIPDTTINIGSEVLKDCNNICEITIPNSAFGDYEKSRFGYLFGLGYVNYYLDEIANESMPDGVTDQGYFEKDYYGGTEYYKLYYYYIPNSLKTVNVTKTIPKRSFYNCKNITSIRIGINVKSIDEEAFYYCNSLKDIYYLGNNVQWKGISIATGNSSLTKATIHYYIKTFSFNTNGGTSVDEITGTTLNESPITTRENLHFGGWFDNEGLSGEAITFPYSGDITTLYAKWYAVVKFVGEHTETQTVDCYKNAIIPTAPEGYTYIFTVDGNTWNGNNITENATVQVTKIINTYTVTFFGDYVGEVSVEYGKDTVLPTPPEGYTYFFSNGELDWDGTNITSDVRIEVSKLCDLANITINNLQNKTVNNTIINGEYYSKTFVPEIEVSENAGYKIYSEIGCTNKISAIYIDRGLNTYYVKVTAESGKEVIYTLNINCPVPESLGTLSVFQTIGGSIIFKTTETIVGEPEIIICYGSSQNNLDSTAKALYNSTTKTFQIIGLSENTEYYFKAEAVWDGFKAESKTILAKTGITLSSDCYVTSMIFPAGGTIDHENGTISDLRVTNEFEKITVDAEVSAGATWELYASKSAITPIKDNVVDLGIYEGRNRTVYLRVTAEDGTQKTYVMSIYRQTKASAPTISVDNKRVTINASNENCDIYYTIDGTTPNITNGTIYTTPFDVVGGTTIKAIVVDSSMDEVSDVATADVEKNSTVNIEIIELAKSTSGKLIYDIYVVSDTPATGTLFIALYDKDDKYVGLVKCAELVDVSENEYFNSVSIDSKATKYKVLLWNSLSSLRPISTAIGGDIE